MVLELVRRRDGDDVMFAAMEVKGSMALIVAVVAGCSALDADASAVEFPNRGVSVGLEPCMSPVPVLNGAVNAKDAIMKSILHVCTE